MRDRDLARAEFQPLGLSSRTVNALWCRDICTLNDLAKLTERDISLIPGIGPKAKAQLRNYLRADDAPIPEVHDRPRAVPVIFDPSDLTAIDSWALENGPIKARAEAVRRLVRLALRTARKGQKAEDI